MLWGQSPLENSVYFAIFFKIEVLQLQLLNSGGNPSCLALEKEATDTTEQWGKKQNNGKFNGYFWFLLMAVKFH